MRLKLMLQKRKLPKNCHSYSVVQCDPINCGCCTLNVTLTCAWRSQASFWRSLLIEEETWLEEDYLFSACY